MCVFLCRFIVIKLTMASSLQPASEHWLLGKPQSELSTARLACEVDVLCVVQFHHPQQKYTCQELQSGL